MSNLGELLQVTHAEKMKILEHYNLTEEQMIDNVRIIKEWLEKNAHLPKENGEFVATIFITAMNPLCLYNLFSLHWNGNKIIRCPFFSFTLDKRWRYFNGTPLFSTIYFN